MVLPSTKSPCRHRSIIQDELIISLVQPPLQKKGDAHHVRVHIQSCENIIKQKYLGRRIDGSCQCDSCLSKNKNKFRIFKCTSGHLTFCPPLVKKINKLHQKTAQKFCHKMANLSVSPLSPTSVSSPASKSSKSRSRAHWWIT